MELKILGSSSAGNCYLLDNGKETLMIECGVSFRKVSVSLSSVALSCLASLLEKGKQTRGFKGGRQR